VLLAEEIKLIVALREKERYIYMHTVHTATYSVHAYCTYSNIQCTCILYIQQHTCTTQDEHSEMCMGSKLPRDHYK